MIRRVVAAAAPPLCGLFLLVPTAAGAPWVAAPPETGQNTANPLVRPGEEYIGPCRDAEGNVVPTRFTFPPVDPTLKPTTRPKPTQRPTAPKPTVSRPKPTGQKPRPVAVVDGQVDGTEAVEAPDCPSPTDGGSPETTAPPEGPETVVAPITEDRPEPVVPIVPTTEAPITPPPAETSSRAPAPPPGDEEPGDVIIAPPPVGEPTVRPPVNRPVPDGPADENPVAPPAESGAAPPPAPPGRPDPTTTPPRETPVRQRPVVVERPVEPFTPPSTTFLPETLPANATPGAVEPGAQAVVGNLAEPRRQAPFNGWMLAMVILAVFGAGGLLVLFSARTTPAGAESGDDGGLRAVNLVDD